MSQYVGGGTLNPFLTSLLCTAFTKYAAIFLKHPVPPRQQKLLTVSPERLTLVSIASEIIIKSWPIISQLLRINFQLREATLIGDEFRNAIFFITNMAAHFPETPVVSREEYNGIFGDTDTEVDVGDSDIDVSEVGDESESGESGSKTEIESESHEPIEWTNRLRSIAVGEFTSPVEITFELTDESREVDVLKGILR